MTLAIISLSPPSGLNQPMRRQNSLGSDQRAQQCYFLDSEVAAVISAFDSIGHPTTMKARLLSSFIEHGSHGDRSSGGPSGIFGACFHPRLQPAQDVDAVQGGRADDRVHHGREPGAGLAVGAELQPSSDRRRSERPFGEIVIQRHLEPVGEDEQPFAMVHQRAKRLALARLVGQADEGLLQRALYRVEYRSPGLDPRVVMTKPRLV